MCEDIEKAKRDMDKKEVLNRCCILCSKAEYSICDIREKLRRWGVDRNSTDEIIEYLCNNNYINESRYAECFVSEKFRLRHWGRIKIGYALRQKKVADEYISTAMGIIDEDIYFDTLKQLILNKSKGDISDLKKRASVYNFAISRGFEAELINKALRELGVRNEEFYE